MPPVLKIFIVPTDALSAEPEAGSEISIWATWKSEAERNAVWRTSIDTADYGRIEKLLKSKHDAWREGIPLSAEQAQGFMHQLERCIDHSKASTKPQLQHGTFRVFVDDY